MVEGAGNPVIDNGAPLNGSERVLGTLRLLGAYPEGVKLHELARALDSPKSSVHRALAALRRAELAEQDADGRYRLGYGFLQLAFSYYDRLDDVERVRPVLSALAEHFGETTHYAVLRDAEIVYVAKVQPSLAKVRMTSVVGGRNPAHCTGVGKALLAYRLRTRPAVEEYVSRYGPLERRTAHTLVSVEELHAELSLIRRRGFSTDREENEAGINCLSLPLFLTGRYEPDGAMSITALAQRNPVENLVAGLADACTLIGEKLGAVTPPAARS